MSKLITQLDLKRPPAPRVTPRPVRMDDLPRKVDRRNIDTGKPAEPPALPTVVVATGRFVPGRRDLKVYTTGRIGKRVPKREAPKPPEAAAQAAPDPVKPPEAATKKAVAKRVVTVLAENKDVALVEDADRDLSVIVKGEKKRGRPKKKAEPKAEAADTE